MNLSLHDLIGSAGVVLIVGTYLLMQLGRMDGRGVVYPALNAVGAALILYSLTVDFNLSAAIVEGFWLAISVVGVVLGRRRKRREAAARQLSM